MKKTNKTAVIYARSATNNQSAIEMQIKSCRNYANKNGIEIKQIFIEKSSAIKYKKQSMLQKAQKYLTKNKVNCFLVHTFNRLSRNVVTALEAEVFFAKNNIELVAVSETSKESNSTGRFVRITILSMAQLSNEMKNQRVKEGMTSKFKNGYWMWAAPFGYSKIQTVVGSEIRPKQDESELVQRIFSMAGTGVSIEEITNHFSQSEKIPKYLKSSVSVRRIIKNPFYKGFMKSSLLPELVEGNYSPLVSVGLWEKANKNIKN